MDSQLPETMPPEGLESQSQTVPELRSPWLYEHVKNVLYERQTVSVRGPETVDVCEVGLRRVCVSDGRHRAWIKLVKNLRLPEDSSDKVEEDMEEEEEEEENKPFSIPKVGDRISICDISVDFDQDERFIYWARFSARIQEIKDKASIEEMLQLPEINEDGGLIGFATTVGCSGDDPFIIKDRLSAHQDRDRFKDDQAFCQHRQMITGRNKFVFENYAKPQFQQFQDEHELELPEEEATQSQISQVPQIPPSPGLDFDMPVEAARHTREFSARVNRERNQPFHQEKVSIEKDPACASDDNHSQPDQQEPNFHLDNSAVVQHTYNYDNEEDVDHYRKEDQQHRRVRVKRKSIPMTTAQQSAKRRHSLVIEPDVAGMVSQWWDEVYARNPRRRPRFPPQLPQGKNQNDLVSAFENEYKLRDYLRALPRSEFNDICILYREDPNETAASCFELELIRLILTLRIKRHTITPRVPPYSSEIKNIILQLEDVDDVFNL
uniref:Uncharacterized protein n=1 Tax=Aureoumbra lagunensis TaxID=44058 RepID=A0A7S3NQP4_9STRA